MTYRGLFVGLTTIDIQYFIEEFPERNVKLKTKPPQILVGGPATNAAVAFSYLNKGACLATVVGKNAFSELIRADFCATNLNLFDLVESKNISPVLASVITSANGDRNIFTHNPSDIVAQISVKELFYSVKPEIVMLDGFYPDFSIECAKLANAKNIPVIIDAGSWKPQYIELLKYTDIAICSADFFPPNCNSQDEVFDFIRNLGLAKIAISRGENSILIQDNKKNITIEVPKVTVVDTLGAGDFLHGAFCYYYLQENNFANALKQAAKLASSTCAFSGTRVWLNQ